MTVTGFSTNSAGNVGNATIEIDGTNFTPTTTASLTLGNTTLTASAISYVDSGLLYATFNLTGAAYGAYTLKVIQGTQSVTAKTPFQVVAAPNVAPLNAVLITPQVIRFGRTGSVVITYTNQTANDLVVPLLNITSTNPNVLFSLPDDPNDYTQSAQILAVAPSGPAGILRPGQSGQITLNILSNDPTDNDTIPVQVNQVLAGQTIDWASQQAALQPDGVPNAAWSVIYGNLVATVGSTTDSYVAVLAQAATYLGNIGETTAQVSDVSRLWAFLASQTNAAFPTTTLGATVDASLPIPRQLDARNRQDVCCHHCRPLPPSGLLSVSGG